MKHGRQLITLRTDSGSISGHATLVRWTDPVLRPTHNGGTKFKYQRGTDANGAEYETKSSGGGWRRVPTRRLSHEIPRHLRDAADRKFFRMCRERGWQIPRFNRTLRDDYQTILRDECERHGITLID